MSVDTHPIRNPISYLAACSYLAARFFLAIDFFLAFCLYLVFYPYLIGTRANELLGLLGERTQRNAVVQSLIDKRAVCSVLQHAPYQIRQQVFVLANRRVNPRANATQAMLIMRASFGITLAQLLV